jgi:hypothetical protein
MERLAVHRRALVVDGVELDQQWIVAHALGGESDLPEDALGRGKQHAKLLMTIKFPH